MRHALSLASKKILVVSKQQKQRGVVQCAGFMGLLVHFYNLPPLIIMNAEGLVLSPASGKQINPSAADTMRAVYMQLFLPHRSKKRRKSRR
jgi:hypothetical protein